MKNILAFIKKYKLVFIITFCVILFIIGLVRDIDKNKDDKKIDNNEVIPNDEKIVLRINGGVNKDYYGYINNEMYLFEAIINYCDGLSDYANIDNIDLTFYIDSDYFLTIKEDETIHNNTFNIIDISKSIDYTYKCVGRINNKINIYKVDSDLSEEDFKILTKLEEDTTGKININTCSISDLESIPKLKSKASAIIEYRNKNGKFEKIEDIKKVSGIGDATYEAVKDLICVK